jgi:hypothetical protein
VYAKSVFLRETVSFSTIVFFETVSFSTIVFFETVSFSTIVFFETVLFGCVLFIERACRENSETNDGAIRRSRSPGPAPQGGQFAKK